MNKEIQGGGGELSTLCRGGGGGGGRGGGNKSSGHVVNNCLVLKSLNLRPSEWVVPSSWRSGRMGSRPAGGGTTVERVWTEFVGGEQSPWTV